MSERSERLFEALGEIDEGKIDEAAPAEKRVVHWKRWTALAAAFVLVIGAGSYVLPRLGGNAGSAGAGGAGAGSDGASTFMSYAGPVFPLTLREADSAILAEREITLDFAPWIPVWWSNEEEANRDGYTPEQRQETLDMYNEWYPEGGRWKSSTDIRVADAYTLTNTSNEDKTVSVLYPFAGMLNDLENIRPTLTAGGQELETTLYAGQYSGGFQGAWEGWPNRKDNPGSVNLDQPNSWEDFRDRLEDGDYLRSALGEWADLSGVPVTVYQFTDPWGPEPDEEAGVPNPTIRVYFDLDYDRTEVLSYGFNGGSYDRENGRQGKSFSIPRDFWPERSKFPKYLIVLGNDIRNITAQGCVTGGWDDEKTLEAGVTIQRYESNLEDILYTVAQYALREEKDFDLSYGIWKDWLLSYGVLADDPMERYRWGDIEHMDVDIMSRVFYLEAQVTIPAGGSVQLSAEMTKEGSYDFACAHTENRGIYGYDMVTKLGSNLICTGQTAVLEDRGQIRIIRQNFGFDLENGVKQVTLDPSQEHYYLEIKGREDRFGK